MCEHHHDNHQARTISIGPYHIEFAAGASARLDEYRLRYRIFVEERAWLLSDDKADQLEIDEFDPASCAFLLRDAATGEAAACQRFVLPERLSPGQVTQIERLTEGLGLDIATRPRDSWAEVSRTCIAPKYRWGSSETSMPAMIPMKYASLALALALQRDTLFSVSDPRTARLTRRLGVPLHQIGPIVDYHGRRAPFRIDVPELLSSVSPEMHDLLVRLTIEAARVCSPAD